MSIRPADIQASIWQATQTAPVNAKAEEAPHAAQLNAQASFVAAVQERQERVGDAGNASGNRVDARPDRERQELSERKKRPRQPGEPFDEVIHEAAGDGDGEHIVDYTA
jgi:hypothetical protein